MSGCEDVRVRVFNTVGPCLPDRHYMVPPEPRLPEARGLVAGGYYFVVHAPRQTGKTTTLAAIADHLRAEGEYAGGRLDFRRLLEEFADSWCEHGEVLSRREKYHEVAPQLVIMGFLHRIVNGGGYITREYGVGSGRIDLEVRWPYTDPDGKRAWQREAVELKVWHPNRGDPLATGLRQLDGYLDRLGLDRGTLVVFDRRPQDPPAYASPTFSDERTPTGRPVTLLRA